MRLFLFRLSLSHKYCELKAGPEKKIWPSISAFKGFLTSIVNIFCKCNDVGHLNFSVQEIIPKTDVKCNQGIFRTKSWLYHLCIFRQVWIKLLFILQRASFIPLKHICATLPKVNAELQKKCLPVFFMLKIQPCLFWPFKCRYNKSLYLPQY